MHGKAKPTDKKGPTSLGYGVGAFLSQLYFLDFKGRQIMAPGHLKMFKVKAIMVQTSGVQVHVGGCQNYGPFLGCPKQ